MDEILKNLPGLAKDKYKENKKFFFNLRQKTPKDLDVVMKELHDKEFAKTDCLSCANCCKTTGPLMTDKDITRISSHFRMKDQKFIETYLRVDDDGDFIHDTLDSCHYSQLGFRSTGISDHDSDGCDDEYEDDDDDNDGCDDVSDHDEDDYDDDAYINVEDIIAGSTMLIKRPAIKMLFTPLKATQTYCISAGDLSFKLDFGDLFLVNMMAQETPFSAKIFINHIYCFSLLRY